MRPYININIGDLYQRYIGSIEFMVISKNNEEKMIEIQGIDTSGHPIGQSFWKSNKDSIFTRRIYENIL